MIGVGCMKRGCDRVATHALKICVPVAGEENEATVLIGVKLCEPCLEEENAQRWFDSTGDTLKPVLRMAQPGKELDWDNARTDGVVLGSEEHAVLERFRLGIN